MRNEQDRKRLRHLGRSLLRELSVLESRFGLCDVTPTQSHLLFELEAKEEPSTARELAERLALDKSVVSRAVADLMKAGLVCRKRDSSDARRKPLWLTASGRKKVAKIHEISERRVSKALAVLNERELKAVVDGLSLYVKALNRVRTGRG